MDYRNTALALIKAVGGAGNIIDCNTYLTRLRLQFGDPSLVDLDALTKIRSVLGVIPRAGDAFDVVFASSVVDEVYHDLAIACAEASLAGSYRTAEPQLGGIGSVPGGAGRSRIISTFSSAGDDTHELARILDRL